MKQRVTVNQTISIRNLSISQLEKNHSVHHRTLTKKELREQKPGHSHAFNAGRLLNGPQMSKVTCGIILVKGHLHVISVVRNLFWRHT